MSSSSLRARLVALTSVLALAPVPSIAAPPDDAPATEAPSAEAPSADPAPPELPDPGAPPGPEATPEEQAEWWFGEGARLGEEGDFVGSARAFERSVSLLRTREGLYNRAVAYEYAKMPLEALAAWEDYVGEVGRRSDDAASVAPAMDALKAKIGRIDIRLARGHTPEKILLDGEPRTKQDFPVRVLPGAHDVVIVEKDGERREQGFDLEPGSLVLVDFSRPAQEGPASGPTFQPPRFGDDGQAERRRRATRALFYTSAGLTGAAGISLGVFGALTQREKRLFEEGLCGDQEECSGEDPEYPADHERRFADFKTTTNVLVGVTAGLAAVTLVLGIVSFTQAERREKSDSARVRWGVGGLRMHF